MYIYINMYNFQYFIFICFIKELQLIEEKGNRSNRIVICILKCNYIVERKDYILDYKCGIKYDFIQIEKMFFRYSNNSVLFRIIIFLVKC